MRAVELGYAAIFMDPDIVIRGDPFITLDAEFDVQGLSDLGLGSQDAGTGMSCGRAWPMA